MNNIKPKSIQDQKEEYTKTREVLNLFNRFCETNKMPESKIYRNLIQEETDKLINQFNKSELFEVVYFSTLEGLYNEVQSMNNKIYVYAFIGKIFLNIIGYASLILLVLSISEYCLRG